MPPFLIVFVVAGVAFLLYERFWKPGSAGNLIGPPPTPSPEARCVPATSIAAGRRYLFAMVPVGAGDTQTTPAQVAALVSTGGLWINVQAWSSIDPSVPAYSWPPGAQPGPGVFLVRATYAGPAAAVPAPGVVQGMLDCGPARGQSDGGTDSASNPAGFHLTGPVYYQGSQPPAPPGQPGPRSIPVQVAPMHGMEGAVIQQATMTQLAAMGPQPSGIMTSLQWQIAQGALQSLYSAPTIPNLRSTIATLSQPSQGAYANNAAAGLASVLAQLGG